MNELVNVNSLNHYLYCPRRLWYTKFFDTISSNYYLVDGSLKHDKSSERGGWIKEVYMKDKEVSLHGKIDVVETGDYLTPVERKRGNYYRENDVIQLASYCLLLEKNTGQKTRDGIIYLYETDQRNHIALKNHHFKKVKKIVQKIKSMNPDNLPPFVDNLNKCKKCSVKSYCMPLESKKLGEINEG